MITKIREELKGKFSSKNDGAVSKTVVAVLIGAAVCLTVCTLIMETGLFASLIPLWLFIGFALLHVVLGMVPYTASRWWLRLLVFAGVCAVLILLLVLF